jgi:hypothetical protein
VHIHNADVLARLDTVRVPLGHYTTFASVVTTAIAVSAA